MGSGSVQGAGAPTMFQAMKRIAGCLARNNVNEGAIERAIRRSFLGTIHLAVFELIKFLSVFSISSLQSVMLTEIFKILLESSLCSIC